MATATHSVTVKFYDSFPKHWTKQMIYAAMIERFKFLGDKLENVIVVDLSKKES